MHHVSNGDKMKASTSMLEDILEEPVGFFLALAKMFFFACVTTMIEKRRRLHLGFNDALKLSFFEFQSNLPHIGFALHTNFT